MTDQGQRKLKKLNDILEEMGSVVVAFSGGVDSTFLLRVAADRLGDRVLAATGRSPSLATSELKEAQELAREFGIEHLILDTQELESPEYAANGPDRCYHCKSELFTRLEEVRSARNYAVLCDGTNADDGRDVRPGKKAGLERGVRSPLAEAGLTKAEIRDASAALGLSTAGKPALACLASRVPHGVTVTLATLGQVEAAEARVRALGFSQFRVRHHGDVARLEVAPEEMDRAAEPSMRAALAEALRAAGYRFVALDLEGYKDPTVAAR